MARLKFGEIRINDTAKTHIKDCLDRNWPTMGPKTLLMESEWANKFRVKYVSGVSSGTDALICALMSLYDFGAERGDYVVIPALSFIATCNAVLAAGFQPLLVDVRHDMLIDESQIEAAILAGGHKVRAIVPVTLMGAVPQMDYIREIAKKYKLSLIVDNCEGHLCEFQGQNMEHWADAAVYSCFAAHVVTASEIGIVATNYKEIDSTVKSVRTHGRRNGALYFDFQRFGLNCKPTDIDASLVLGSLQELTWTFYTRKYNYYFLRKGLGSFEDQAYFTNEKPGTLNSPHAFSIILKTPGRIDALKKHLDEADIEWKINFGAYHLHPALSYLAKPGDFPVAEYCGKNGLHIGIHAYLSTENIQYILTTLTNFFQETQ